MSRMDLVANEALRLNGWRVFRSASRDRLIPGTGLGAQLQRLVLREARPVPGVLVGVSAGAFQSAVTSEERASAVSSEESRLQQRAVLLRRATEERGISWQRVCWGQDTSGLAGNVTRTECGMVAFDSLISEITFIVQGGGGAVGSLRVEIDNYGTVLSGGGVNGLGFPVDTVAVQPFPNLSGDGTVFSVRNLRWFVGGGSRIFLDVVNGGGGFTVVGEAIIVAESLSPSQRQVVTRPDEVPIAHVLGLRREAERVRLERQQAEFARIAEEREQLLAERRARLEALKQVPASASAASPFGQLLFSPEAARQLASRAPVPPPPPRVSRPKPVPPEGAGQTFVSAWNPSFGSIGYLIPDPPRGGKVNVFDNTYTIWDISGKNVGSGPIIPIASDGEIPPGARISPSIRGTVRRG